MIEVTVALPMLQSRHIGWIAFESLCRQENLRDIEWELLVAEETGEAHGPFGEENVLSYAGRLREANCRRLEYFGLRQWMPLSRKWKFLAEKASAASRMFLLQAADDYSQPYRLAETHHFFAGEADWVQSPKGIYYNIPDGKTILFNHENFPHPPHPGAVNMAIRTALARQLPDEDVAKGVDAWLFRAGAKIKGSELNVGWNKNDTWKLGVITNGLNNLTERDDWFIRLKVPFERCDIDMADCLPEDILQRLRACKNFCDNASEVELPPTLGFHDLQVGRTVKVKGKPGENGSFQALEINVQKPSELAVIEGLIQDIDHEKNTLTLANRAFALPNGITAEDMRRTGIALQDLKPGTRAKLKGRYAAPIGFVPVKIKKKKIKGFNLEELQHTIDTIDRENHTFDLLGFKVRVDERTVIY